jgi:glycosyltransferase involved in cell wall biosynthesis
MINSSTTPLVSVLMTAYNREKYIAEAIESVLASTYIFFELIIVDDCSTDNTVLIAKSYQERDPRIKLFVNKHNLGDYPNRNVAASFASGVYIKYLDSDDIMYPQCLELMVAGMLQFPKAAFGVSLDHYDNQLSLPKELQPTETIIGQFDGLGYLDIGPTAVIFNASIFNMQGGFTGSRYWGDTELLLALSSEYSLVLLPGSLVYWRVHEDQEMVHEYRSGANFDRMDLLYNFLNQDLTCITSIQRRMLFRKLLISNTISVLKNTLKKRSLNFLTKYSKYTLLSFTNIKKVIFN